MSSERYQRLFVDKGETIVQGKPHWPDLVQVHIEDPKDAFSLAMDILRQVENQQHHEKATPVKITLTGTLEPDEE